MPVSIFAQQDDVNWVFKSPYAGKYYESPYDIRWGLFEHSESGRFDIKSATDAQLIIKKKLQPKVIAVELANIPSNQLQSVFSSLGQFPNLVYIKLLGRGGSNQDEKINVLIANINKLPRLKCIEFAHIDSIDIDAALKKLIPIKQLNALSFTDYNRELPLSITLLNQIDSIKLSTVNIGRNNLNNVNWQKVSVMGNPKSWSDLTGAFANEEGEIIAKLSNLKSLKQLGLDVDLRYPDFISKFTQIEELNIGGVIEGRPSSPFMQAIGALKQLKKLSVELTGYQLVTNISPLKNLTQLSSFFLKLNEYPVSGIEILNNFKNLENLEIAQCQIGVMPDVFKDMRYLKTVALVKDGLTKIPESLFNVPSLESLNLSFNKLTVLPNIAFYGCTKLKYVKLIMNQLTSLPQAFGGLLNLETVNCTNNKIESIPGGWADLKYLKDVDFSSNRLRAFPDGLQNNHSVERIALPFNQIETFPDVDGEDYKLKFLNITGNHGIFELPLHIGNYTELETLQAEYLTLKTLPESLGNCKKLQMLLLNRSIIGRTQLPAGLRDARMLETLQLNDNPLLDHQSIFDVILSIPRTNFSVSLDNDDINHLPLSDKWLTIPFAGISLKDNPINQLPPQFINSKIKGFVVLKGTNIH